LAIELFMEGSQQVHKVSNSLIYLFRIELPLPLRTKVYIMEDVIHSFLYLQVFVMKILE
jgi:hypothetical protein